MNSIQYQELDFNFLYKIEGFRYLSNINGLSLLDGTYLERLITAILKNKNLISDKGIINLKDLITVFNVNTTKAIKKILTRLSDVGALLYKKIGKHHEENYIIIIDPVYIQFFFLGR